MQAELNWMPLETEKDHDILTFMKKTKDKSFKQSFVFFYRLVLFV